MNENRAIEWLRPAFEEHRIAVEAGVRRLLNVRSAADRGKIKELRRANALMREALVRVDDFRSELPVQFPIDLLLLMHEAIDAAQKVDRPEVEA